jgi:hypothetical protein
LKVRVALARDVNVIDEGLMLHVAVAVEGVQASVTFPAKLWRAVRFSITVPLFPAGSVSWVAEASSRKSPPGWVAVRVTGALVEGE